jgi:hypothetical protein
MAEPPRVSSGLTFYQVFDLDEHATPQQIRIAYLRLMKVHHPDKSAARQVPDFVALINLCYETLSDPAKRATYDAQLRQRRKKATFIPFTPAFGPETKRPRSRGLATAIVVCAGCLLLAVGLTSPKLFNIPQSRLIFWPENVSAEPEKLPRLTQPDLQRQVKLAKSLSPNEALALSERCFREAQVEQSGKAVQLCIIFDDAFLYWRQTPQWNALMPYYFDDEVVHTRHRASLLRFKTNAEGTLAQLRYEAFRALLHDVDNPEVQAGEPT